MGKKRLIKELATGRAHGHKISSRRPPHHPKSPSPHAALDLRDSCASCSSCCSHRTTETSGFKTTTSLLPWVLLCLGNANWPMTSRGICDSAVKTQGEQRTTLPHLPTSPSPSPSPSPSLSFSLHPSHAAMILQRGFFFFSPSHVT